MSTIAIVGMGPLVGLSLAREFGRRGFRVAMIARRRHALEDFAKQLASEGIFVGTVAIGVQVERNGTKCDPDRIAEVFWRLHEKRDEHDVIYA
ncbi:hypothetical protein K2X89_10185 [Myxococcota bacterium]|nr:hypothetical protein [Myxococcota bacterium]